MQVPYFNAPIFLENKSQVGKVDEIFGKIKESVRGPPPFCCSSGESCLLWRRPWPQLTAPRSAEAVALTVCGTGLQMFTVKMSEGVQAASYKKGDKFYIDPYKLLPMERFLGGDSGGRGVPRCACSVGLRAFNSMQHQTFCCHAIIGREIQRYSW